MFNVSEECLTASVAVFLGDDVVLISADGKERDLKSSKDFRVG
jgi:hypothetical protein